MRRSRASTAAGIALLAIAAVLAATTGYLGTQTARRPPPVARRPATSVPAAEVAAGARPVALAVAGAGGSARSGAGNPGGKPAGNAALRRALAVLGTAPALGGGFRLHVTDLSAGTLPAGAAVYDHGGAVPVAPASTAKLLTAAALLQVRRPTDRLSTTVRATGTPGTVVLVGAGDPTLSGAAPGRPTPYAGAARLAVLASSLRARHVRVRRLLVDDRLFRGPAVSPAWAPEDVPSSYAAPITALLADGGRDTPTAARRSTSPDLAAGRLLARLLGTPRLPVARAAAATRAGAVLAEVRSAPLGELILQMLHTSDNVLAECLARQVALATGRPASFGGAAAAIRSVLAPAGVTVGTGLRDASGLAPADRVAPAALTAVLGAAAGTPRLRALLDALPVAGWSGTLAGRYRTSALRGGDGLIRAKTGTLTGVSALAGLVHTNDDHLLAFAALADHAPATVPAEAALDAIADRLARS